MAPAFIALWTAESLSLHVESHESVIRSQITKQHFKVTTLQSVPLKNKPITALHGNL